MSELSVCSMLSVYPSSIDHTHTHSLLRLNSFNSAPVFSPPLRADPLSGRLPLGSSLSQPVTRTSRPRGQVSSGLEPSLFGAGIRGFRCKTGHKPWNNPTTQIPPHRKSHLPTKSHQNGPRGPYTSITQSFMHHQNARGCRGVVASLSHFLGHKERPPRGMGRTFLRCWRSASLASEKVTARP